MSRLIRMDHTGHTTLAEWTTDDPETVEAAVTAFRAELEQGYFGMVSTGEGQAEQVREREAVHWRPMVDEARLRRAARLWTTTTLAHVVPFVGAGAGLVAVEPLALPVALAALAHA